MFLGDCNLNSVCLIVDDTPVKTLIMTFFEDVHLGHEVKIVNSVLTGYFNGMAVIKCEGITPSNFIFTITKNIVVNNNADERCVFARFSTKSLV